MKLLSVFGTLVFGLAASAPAFAASAPASAHAAVLRASLQAPDTAPPNWWLLDENADRLRGIGAERAYRELLAGRQPARQVVVAVIDSGIDDEHEDLNDNLWVNEDEIPGNGKDDDNNGYVDDRHGWNFIGGRNGEHVNFDTYESVRLYAGLRKQCEGVRVETLPAQARTQCEQFPAIKQKFQADRAEAEEQLEQIRQIDDAVGRVVEVLKQQLRTDTLTPDAVAGIQSLRMDVIQAKQIYQQLVSQGITPEQIHEQRESLEGRLKYGLNPEFDPRPTVGDNYANVNERGYGNPDIEGPSADHGTHVAGIIGAERGNNTGINGIAPAVRLMILRTVPDGDERDKDVANAIRYAADNGAQIINMSFGKAYSPQKEAVDAAVRYADERGVLMVHAAGNDAADIGNEPSFPTRTYLGGGQPKNWIEVGASTWQGEGQLASPFSNYGRQHVDVFAPGSDIYSTIPESRYGRNSGTSMAAPVVSGIAALLMAYYPNLTGADVKRIILESATRYTNEAVLRPGSEQEKIPFGELSATGAVVNAVEAIRLAEKQSGR